MEKYDQLFATLTATTEKTNDNVMKLTLDVGTILARLDAIDKITSSSSISSKRLPKLTPTDDDNVSETSSTAKSKSTKPVKAKAPKKAETNISEKIINALAYFKFKIVHENDRNLREKYITEELLAKAEKEVKIPKSDSIKYSGAIGTIMWRELGKAKQANVKEDYLLYKREEKTSEDNTQLNEDGNDSE